MAGVAALSGGVRASRGSSCVSGSGQLHADSLLTKRQGGECGDPAAASSVGRHGRSTALTPQRGLLRRRPPEQPAVEVASRYRPAGAHAGWAETGATSFRCPGPASPSWSATRSATVSTPPRPWAGFGWLSDLADVNWPPVSCSLTSMASSYASSGRSHRPWTRSAPRACMSSVIRSPVSAPRPAPRAACGPIAARSTEQLAAVLEALWAKAAAPQWMGWMPVLAGLAVCEARAEGRSGPRESPTPWHPVRSSPGGGPGGRGGPAAVRADSRARHASGPRSIGGRRRDGCGRRGSRTSPRCGRGL